MAIIAPFRGIFYNREKIQDLRDVITPPYDVISERERQEYFKRHPQNMIRLILSKGDPQDTNRDNRYTRAAECFRSWLHQGILTQDTEPAIYLTEIDYDVEDVVRTRFGVIALVQLEDFEKGSILPHEKTFSATKADRLSLMQTCKANFSPVFSLFSDPDGEIVRPLRSCIKGIKPDFEFKELIGSRHQLWRVTDQRIHKKIQQKLYDKPLYIADGHHRYETALNFRNQTVAKSGTLDPKAACNFVMMYLCSIHDPGLTIRPVHRLLSHVPQHVIDGFAEKAHAYFDIETLQFGAADRAEVLAGFLAKIRAGAESGVIGAVLRDHRVFYVLRIREGIMDRLFDGQVPVPLRKLDVTIATKLVFQKIFDLDDAALDDERRILYTSRTEKALEAVSAGKCEVALILNPTRLSNVEEISEAGLTMPRKSTYFYPKVMSGLVINKIADC
ncbi:MAG: DUF1015 domain-containing protein [Proteobacteria bacterium]|nr:DUF1015 domain-containing protein [Pseudomonadota bacterium]